MPTLIYLLHIIVSIYLTLSESYIIKSITYVKKVLKNEIKDGCIYTGTMLGESRSVEADAVVRSPYDEPHRRIFLKIDSANLLTIE